MSAYLVTHATIAAIVTFAQRRVWSCIPPLPRTSVGAVNVRDIDPDTIGQALHDENIRSVNYRYRRTDPAEIYRHRPTFAGAVSLEETRTLRALDVIKICRCVEYQSCEHPEWETSWSRTFLQQVVDAAINDLPGYDVAPWGLYPPNHGTATPGAVETYLALSSLPRVYATLADATLPDDIRRDAVAALLRGCTVSDILMHLRDACRAEAERFKPDDHPHQHFALAADAIQHLRETTAI